MTALDEVLAVLGGSLPAPPSKFLSVNCPLSVEELASLCTILERSEYTGGIRLGSYCQIGDKGAEALARAVSKNRALDSLELPGKNVARFAVVSCTFSSLSHSSVISRVREWDNNYGLGGSF